jgi:hypothetical protein
MFRGAFPAISNRQSFIDAVELYDDEDGTLVDLTGCIIQVEIRPAGLSWPSDSYWSAGWGWGYGLFGSTRLLASTADGSIIIPDVGTFIFTFTPAQIASLCPGLYELAANISRDDETVQLILGTMPVLDGVVPQ